MAQQTKTGRHFKWYFNGQVVGMSLVKSLKPERSLPLEAVNQCGSGDVFEYAQKVQETSLTLDYTLISYSQLATAAGQTVVNEVPDLPTNMDIVEKMIVAGTEGTATEQAQGWAIYQRVQFEKEGFDIEADKVTAVNLSAKCKRPRRYPGANGIQFDTFSGNGVKTSFQLTKTTVRQGADAFWTIRAEYPVGTVLQEGVDYSTTVAAPVSGITASASVVFLNSVVPASAANNVIVVYAY